MEPGVFNKNQIIYDEEDPYQAYRNYQTVVTGLTVFYKNFHMSEDQVSSYEQSLVFGQIEDLNRKLNTMRNDIEQTSIKSINQAAFVNLESLQIIMEMALGVAVNCDNTEQIIGSFTEKLNEQTLDDLMQIT